jgi:hypothetical protein
MKRLNGMDAMLLYSEAPNLHTHTLKVAVIDPADVPGFGFEAFRDHVRRRLPLLDPLRYKLVDIPWRLHHPMWLEDCDPNAIDLDYHLRRAAGESWTRSSDGWRPRRWIAAARCGNSISPRGWPGAGSP